MLKQYILLYNYDLDEYGTEMIDAILTHFPEAKLENFTVCRPMGAPERNFDENCASIWIPSDQFLAAWVFVNMYVTEADNQISKECLEDFLAYETIEDGITYMNSHLADPELFVCDYEV